MSDWYTLGIFMLMFAACGALIRFVSFPRPVVDDQLEHWADDVPWPLARQADRLHGKGQEAIGGSNGAVGFPNSVLHGEDQ